MTTNQCDVTAESDFPRIKAALVKHVEAAEMSDINDGGPAFPVESAAGWQAHGISMRDYFAAKAMQGEISAMQDPLGDVCGIALDVSDETLSRLTRHYYRIADAMLKARDAK